MPGPGAFLVGEEERRHVAEVMETGYLSRYGKEDNPKFKHKVVTLEQRFAERSGVKHALAVNGGTGAIMASLVALGVGPGVEVLVPGYTFVASISAVLAVGRHPHPRGDRRVADHGSRRPGREDHRQDQGDHARAHAGKPLGHRRHHGRGPPAQAPRARGLLPGHGRLLQGQAHRDRREHRRVLAELHEDHHERRRRPRHHRRHRALRARLRLPRPGAQAAAHGPRDRKAVDPRHQPADERALRGLRPRPAREAGPDHLDAEGPQGAVQERAARGADPRA